MRLTPGGAAEMPRSFGATFPIAAAPPEWKPWTVVRRARGFHVSRETKDGTQHEFVRNELRKVKFFRALAAAQAACALANGGTQ